MKWGVLSTGENPLRARSSGEGAKSGKPIPGASGTTTGTAPVAIAASTGSLQCPAVSAIRPKKSADPSRRRAAKKPSSRYLPSASR